MTRRTGRNAGRRSAGRNGWSVGASIAITLLVACERGGTQSAGTAASRDDAVPAVRPTEGESARPAPDDVPQSEASAPPAASHPVLPEELSRVPGMIEGGWFDAAREKVEKYIEKHGETGPSVFLLGLVHHKQKQYGQAQEYFEKALEMSPDFAVVHHFFGYCLYNLGDLEGAAREFEAHLEAQPEEGDSHFGLGLIALDENRLDDAEARFRTAIKLNERIAIHDPERFKGRLPDLSKCHARLADVFIAREQFEKARDELLLSIDIYDRHYTVYHTLSTVYRRLGEEELADQMLRTWESVRGQVRPELENHP